MHKGPPLVIAGREFPSRLLVGTGKFSSNEAMRDALEASGTGLVTVALRRADLSGKKDPYANILDFIDPARYLLLPNTSGAMNAAEAVRLARLARSAGLPNWVKLEIHPDPRYLLPDPVETFLAARELVQDGFVVLPYINADPVLAKRLQDVGVATVMPLGSPIGSNRGIETRAQIEIIIEQARCRWSWTRASARRARRRRRWKWARTRCSSIPPSPWRTIRRGWHGRSAWRWKQGARRTRSGWAQGPRRRARRVR